MSRHRAVLSSLLDTLYPSLPKEAARAREAGNELGAYAYALSASNLPFFVEQVSYGALCRPTGHLVSPRREQAKAPHASSPLRRWRSPSGASSQKFSVTLRCASLPASWCLCMHLRVHPSNEAHACRLFGLLEWRAGTLALGGTAALTWQFPFCAAFADLPHAQREQLLLSWANSRLLVFQKVQRPSCLCKVFESSLCCPRPGSLAKRCANRTGFQGHQEPAAEYGAVRGGRVRQEPHLAVPGLPWCALRHVVTKRKQCGAASRSAALANTNSPAQLPVQAASSSKCALGRGWCWAISTERLSGSTQASHSHSCRKRRGVRNAAAMKGCCNLALPA